jgi:hypothetical protein
VAALEGDRAFNELAANITQERGADLLEMGVHVEEGGRMGGGGGCWFGFGFGCFLSVLCNAREKGWAAWQGRRRRGKKSDCEQATIASVAAATTSST